MAVAAHERSPQAGHAGAMKDPVCGMSVDPHVIWEHAPGVLAVTAVVVVGQLSSVAVGSFLSGHDVRTRC